MATGEPTGFGSIVGGTASSSTLDGLLGGLNAGANLANQQQAQNVYNMPVYYQSAIDPGTTYASTTSGVYGISYNGAQFIAQETKKFAKKAFAALVDEITEWHGDVLAV